MIMQEIYKRQPLIHCLTNYVTANFISSGLVAAGIPHVMSDEAREVAEIAGTADSVLLNIGTINTFTQESMIVAGLTANIREIPIVFDPMGIGKTSFRKRVAFEILEEIQVDLIRCNSQEIAILAQFESWQSKGIDREGETNDIIESAKSVARKYNCIVAVTGLDDIITDGADVKIISGGNVTVPNVAGTGCLLGAFTAAALTIEGKNLENVEKVLSTYKKIAEEASKKTQQIGSFQVEVINKINSLRLEA